LKEENAKAIEEFIGLVHNSDFDIDDFLDGWRIVDGVEFIDREDGGEGGAENCFSIFKFNGRYFMISYFYYSSMGYYTHSWEDKVTVVEPKERMITVYEAV
jgi:hypothetical protein